MEAAAITQTLRLRLWHRLRRERGFILPVTLGVSVVLAIVGTAAMSYTSQNYGQATRGKADQVAYNAAEAGINDAMAVLNDPHVNALDLRAFCVDAGQALPCTRATTAGGATVTWWGTFDAQSLTWTLTSTATIRNPTGPTASPVRRTATASVSVLASFQQPLNNQAWNYIYSTKTGDPDNCDQELHNSVTIAAPMYVDGNLCLYNSSSVIPATAPPAPAPAVNLVVKGSLTTSNTASIASSSARINQAIVAGGCNGHVPCRWNGGGDPVWATTTGTAPPAIDPPAADFDYWYQNASPGPLHPCTASTGVPPVFENELVNPSRNDSVPVAVDLTPAVSYTCATPSGELSWNALTKTLTVRGAIYIDGNVTVSSQAANNYTGQASLYASGTFSISSSAQLCGGVVGGQCDFGAWNPNTEMLIVAVAGTDHSASDYGAVLGNSSRFQGGILASHAVHISNSAQVEGPLIGSNVDFENSAQAKPFPLITLVPLGTPGNPNVYAEPQRPVYGG
jgi:Tfp pilus assembly protein PilX